MKLSILILLAVLGSISCSNILVVSSPPYYSHYNLAHRLSEGLLRKGHHVTMITPFKQKGKIENYTEIYLEGFVDAANAGGKKDLYRLEDSNFLTAMLMPHRIGYTISDFVLSYKPVLDLLHSNKTFDVVVMVVFASEALLAIPHKLKAHVVYLSTLGSTGWTNNLVANPAQLSCVPHVYLGLGGRMNFYQRIKNIVISAAWESYIRLIAHPYQDKLLHTAFPDAPKLQDLLHKQNSLVLLNSHPSTNEIVPHVPNMIEIGGFHIKNQELPLSLKKFLDESVEGVVYFSMGTNLPSQELPDVKREAILKAFGKLTQKVVWKWEEDSLPDQPGNVYISKWFPQVAILAHPNTKAFITHGGLLSIMESVHFGVPLIGIPIFGDQKMNVNIAVDKGYAISLSYKELTEKTLSKALNEILNNPTYREQARLKSALMRDRQTHPLDEAVYWIEHVIRHNGSSHFRNAGMDLEWYQYEMIDVAAFLLLITSIIVCFLTYLLRYIWATVKSKKVDLKKVQ